MTFNAYLAYAFASFGTALPDTTPNYGGRHVLNRDDPVIQASGPWNQRWISAWAAIGDSFSIGLGAGHSITASNSVSLIPLDSGR